MAHRTTKAQVIKAFERVVKAIGGEVVQGFADPARKGKFLLDESNGGYQIQQYVSNETWGIRTPFGYERYKATEFWYICYNIERAFEESERLRKEACSPPANAA